MKVRKPAVSGIFYPSDKKDLENLIKKLFDSVEEFDIKAVSAISPHAGYIYSGKTASYMYKNLKNNFKRVIILGSSHNYTFNFACLDENEYWLTPFGEISKDIEFEKKLLKYNIFEFNSHYHEREHSLEVQIPFLQYKFKNSLKIVPILIGTFKKETLEKIAKAIREEKDRETFIIASSDFYHGYSYEECVKVNENSKEILERGKAEEFYKEIINDNIMACGASGIYVLLRVYEESFYKRKVLNMTTSRDVTKDKEVGYVVGYISYVIHE
ncbi:MAG: AmmeMemoRadiSam system protein B [Candidatus Hydrothermales bacterium]